MYMSKSIKSVVTLTKAASIKLQNQLKMAKKVDPNRDGIIIGTRTRGCNGHTYKMNYTTRFEKKTNMEKVLIDNTPLYIDNKSLFTLIGSEIDYKDDQLFSGFIFNNPNAKGNCGCGESFNI